MKKLLFALVLCLGLSINNNSNAQVMSKGAILISPNFATGYYGGFINTGYVYTGTFVPAGVLNVDIGVHDYVSVGPYVGFGGRNGYINTAFGARGNFHFGHLIGDKKSVDLLQNDLDLYYTLGMGGRITSSKFNNYHYGYFSMSSSIGVRYYFLDWMGVQGEFGVTEMSWAKFGLTFKL